MPTPPPDSTLAVGGTTELYSLVVGGLRLRLVAEGASPPPRLDDDARAALDELLSAEFTSARSVRAPADAGDGGPAAWELVEATPRAGLALLRRASELRCDRASAEERIQAAFSYGAADRALPELASADVFGLPVSSASARKYFVVARGGDEQFWTQDRQIFEAATKRGRAWIPGVVSRHAASLAELDAYLAGLAGQDQPPLAQRR